MMIGLEQVSYSVPEKELFSGVSCSIQEGDAVGVVGANGSGKSTLLRILAGSLEPESGSRSCSPGLRVRYVPQETRIQGTESIEEYMQAELQQAGISPADTPGSIARACLALGIENWQQSLEHLSGGWQKRVSLATAIAADPDVLLLDEPTNHLDIEGILALERYLRETTRTWVAVSHDRLLLENCPTRILGIDPVFDGQLQLIQGGYSTYLEEREATKERLEKLSATLKNKVRREKEWLARSPSARTTKSRARIDSAYSLMNKLHHVKRKVKQDAQQLQFQATGRKTAELITLEDAAISFGDTPLFSPITFKLTRGMALGVLGPNGSGKSTLLRMMGKQLEPTHGTVKQATHIAIEYFDQLRDSLNKEETLQRALAPESDSVVVEGQSYHVITWAKRFGFTPDQLRTPVGQLSGGEQARVLLSALMQQSADVLFLDEPTNDLDIPTLEMLENQLIEFPGALVLISHDRYFLARVCTHFLGFSRDATLTPYASYDQWEASLQSTPDKEEPIKEVKPPAPERPRKPRLSFKEKYELEHIEETIHQAETALRDTQKEIDRCQSSGEHESLAELFQQLAECQETVDTLFKRWEALEEKQTASEVG